VERFEWSEGGRPEGLQGCSVMDVWTRWVEGRQAAGVEKGPWSDGEVRGLAVNWVSKRLGSRVN
jgi:hypothetical protein